MNKTTSTFGSSSDPPGRGFSNPFRKTNPSPRKESPNKLNKKNKKGDQSSLFTSFNPFNVTTSSTNPFSPSSSWVDNDEETAANISEYSDGSADYVLAGSGRGSGDGGGSLGSKDDLSCATPSPLRYSALKENSGYRNSSRHHQKPPTHKNNNNKSRTSYSKGASSSSRRGGDSRHVNTSIGGSLFGDLLSASFDDKFGYSRSSNNNRKDSSSRRSRNNDANHRVNDQFMLVKVADLLKGDGGNGGSKNNDNSGQLKTVNENVEDGRGGSPSNNGGGTQKNKTNSRSIFCGGGGDDGVVDDEPSTKAPPPPPPPVKSSSQDEWDGPCSTLFFLWLYMTATIYGGMMVLSVVSFLLAFPYTGSFSSERERDFFQLAMLGFAAMFGWVLMSMWISYKEKQYGWAFIASLPSLLIFGAIVVVLQTGSIGPAPTPSPTSYDPYYYRYGNNRQGGGASGDGGYYYNGRWYNNRGEQEDEQRSGDYYYGNGGQGYYGQGGGGGYYQNGQQQEAGGADQQQNYYNNYGG